ncbi:hypothetical protein Bca52824_085779 [Brassica carinata]|uniref:Zinc knuckle CX2CX4HX4C domain-containing protein n=1 Tax=Brassica carinata TaxID=52824 RepID=A0A8X7TM26_BRACI|nr:hypothetical protein Bca52824_085779 [Brassica carinata]
MSHRYSREEKKKWIPARSQTNRKPPVKIQRIDLLIEENKFTLIGRVTNHATQNTKALVDFFLQHWNVSTDLLTILNKAPFHFKRWMIIVQRWEPVLGTVEDCIPTQARVRVLINGLNPLDMTRDISLPSGEIIEVEFSYDNLQKYCFRCHSLSHEKDDCPSLENSRERDRSPNRIGISQRNTMARLDDNRRRYEERKRFKGHQVQHKREAPSSHYQEETIMRIHQSYAPVTSEYRRGREDYNLGRSVSRESGARVGVKNNPHISDSPSKMTEHDRVRDRDRSSQRTEKRRAPSHDSASKIQLPALQDPTPHSTDLRRALSRREDGEASGDQVSSGRRPIRERLMLPDISHSTDLRRSLSLIDDGNEMGGQTSANRPPVKQRLSLLSNGKSRLAQQGTSTGSSRLQDIDIHYLEEIMEPPRLDTSRPSGSRPTGAPHSPPQENSPIRTLSEDRRHVSLRLGLQHVPNQMDSSMQARLSERPGIITRSVAKKKDGKMPQKKKYNTSPLKGVSIKKRRVFKTQNSHEGGPVGNTAAPSQRSWISSSSSNFIDTSISMFQRSMMVTFIYGSPDKSRAQFWNQLTELGLGRDEEAWLVVGDFNDLLDNSEKIGGPLRWEGSFLAFGSFVSQTGLLDLQDSGNSLSWRGNRYSHFIQSRLDRAMINCKWAEDYPSECCEYLRFEGSDHRPVLVHLSQSPPKKRGLFHFDRRLKNKPEIQELVEKHRTSMSYESVLVKICRIRRKIMEWSKLENKNSKELILETQTKLEEALSSTNPEPIVIDTLSQKLEKAYLEEEQYWKQRSRIQWLHSGDRSSAFFHAVTRERRTINKFSVIENSLGQPVFEEEQIRSTVALILLECSLIPKASSHFLSPRKTTLGFKEHSSIFTIYLVLLVTYLSISSRVWKIL